MPVFPYQVGQLLFDGVVNGQKIYSQPGGIGTPVVPQPPQVNPPPNWKNSAYPPYPYCYVGLLNFICGHWANTCEVYTVNDPTTNQRAALCCCPVCSIIQLIVEPAADWWVEFYSLFPIGVRQNAFENVEA
jgi:hypothetical protein